MKTFLNFKQCLILLAAVFSLTSCLKSKDPVFQIVGQGFIQQTVREIPAAEGEEATISSEFKPIFLVQSMNGTPMLTCTATSTGGSMILGKVDGSNGMVWQTTSATSYPKLPIDTYTINATNADGENASYPVSLSSVTNGMESKLKGSIDYKDKKLSVTFNKVKNATAYMVILRTSGSSDNLALFKVLKSYTETEIGEEKPLALPEVEFASMLELGKTYILTAVAIVGTNKSISVIQEGGSVRYTKE